MNTDFRVSVGFQHNIKVRRLKKALGPSGPLCLVFLWGYAAQHCPEGRFELIDREELEAVAGWQGRTGKLVDTLLDLKFLVENEGVLEIHQWAEHNGYASSARIRSERARAAARKRHDTQADAEADAEADAPSPSPNPSPKPNPSPTHKAAKRKKKETDVTDDWVQTLFSRPAYENKNIWVELDKARGWIEETPGRHLTRLFFLKWLNNAKDDPSMVYDPSKDPYGDVRLSAEEIASIRKDEEEILAKEKAKRERQNNGDSEKP